MSDESDILFQINLKSQIVLFVFGVSKEPQNVITKVVTMKLENCIKTETTKIFKSVRKNAMTKDQLKRESLLKGY